MLKTLSILYQGTLWRAGMLKRLRQWPEKKKMEVSQPVQEVKLKNTPRDRSLAMAPELDILTAEQKLPI